MIPPNLWPWRTIGRIAVPVVVLGLAVWQVRAYADRVADAREQEVRALWEADTAARDLAAVQAVAAATALAKAALERNRDIEADYLAKLAAADAGRDDTLRLLQRARDQVRAGASREATSLTIAAQASEARRIEELRRLDDRIAAATADLRVEAGQNADQLDAVLAEVIPQM